MATTKTTRKPSTRKGTTQSKGGVPATPGKDTPGLIREVGADYEFRQAAGLTKGNEEEQRLQSLPDYQFRVAGGLVLP